MLIRGFESFFARSEISYMFNLSSVNEKHRYIYEKIDANYIRVIQPEGWMDLSCIWEDLHDIGKCRDAKKSSYKSTKNWSRYSTHFLGAVGELCFSISANTPANLEDIAEGDGNCDFLLHGSKIDIKSTQYWKNPDLKQYPNPKKWVDYYILCGVDVDKKRAKIFGWASRDQIMNAPKKDYGYGMQCSLNHSVLNSDLKTLFEECEAKIAKNLSK
jgi:hypothetical protein